MTRQQLNVLRLIQECIAEDGIAPTYREIGAMLGIGSPSVILKIANRLIASGYLAREGERWRPRSLSVTPLGHAALGTDQLLAGIASGLMLAELHRRGVRLVEAPAVGAGA